MTIDKAIQLKEAYLRNPLCNLTPDEKDADFLSIEALKRVKNDKQQYYYPECHNLPGET